MSVASVVANFVCLLLRVTLTLFLIMKSLSSSIDEGDSRKMKMYCRV